MKEDRWLAFRMGLNRVNFPLMISLPFVAIVLTLALIGQYIAPHDPMEKQVIFTDASGEFHIPPVPPGDLPEYPLGTDMLGRDIVSRLFWAFKPTLFLAIGVMLVRLVLGMLVGLAAGWGRGVWHDLAHSLTEAAGAMPTLIVAVVLIIALRGLGYGQGEFTFILAMSLTGWPAAARMVEERVRLVRSEPFIEASRALGARDLHIIWKHVLPQINMLLPVMMAFEMASVLMLTAEVGFVGYYVGGTEFYDVPNGADPGATFFPTAGMPELGQMLSGGWHNFIQMPWLASWAGAAFFLAIFTFLLLGEGLKRYARDYRPGTARQMIAGLFGLPVRG